MNEWNDIAVIAPAGDIDISMLDGLRAQVDGLIDAGASRVLVNCQSVGFIDSSGIAFLLSRARRLAAAGGLLSLVNTSANVTRFIQIACLAEVLHVTAAERPPVPVLAPGAMPLWSTSLSVQPGIEHLAYYRHRVADMLADVRMGEGDRFDMALAVGEALSNAYDHADDACGCRLTVTAYADRIVVEVRDSGCGFELGDGDEPEASRERGRGIRLMRMLVDSVEVRRRVESRGTLVRLIKMLV